MKHLIASDYIRPFTLHNGHYLKVYNTRKRLGLPVHEAECYDTREGFAIDGTPLHTRYHVLHDFHLIENETGNKYIIDLVAYNYYVGRYMTLLARQEGSRSHVSIIWRSLTSIDPTIVQAQIQKRQKYTNTRS